MNGKYMDTMDTLYKMDSFTPWTVCAQCKLYVHNGQSVQNGQFVHNGESVHTRQFVHNGPSVHNGQPVKCGQCEHI